MNLEEYKRDIISQAKRSFENVDNIEEDKDLEYLDNITSTTERLTTEPTEGFTRGTRGAAPSVEETKSMKSLYALGKRSLQKIERNETDLSRSELEGLEAIVRLVGRPAILVAGNTFLQPPPEWNILEKHRNQINSMIPSIGRINVKGHPDLDWLGTGFLVGDDVLMTNEHVAIEFTRPDASGKWTFRPGWSSTIDYGQDISNNHSEFQIREVIGIHDEVDMALLRVSRTSNGGTSNPKPLTVSKDFDESKVNERKVYVVGFPARDPRRNDPVEMDRIFGGVYGFKRIQPGKLLSVLGNTKIMEHDCSTLGGNSGSAVIDLETNKVIGLHFSGKYLQANKAISLWKMTNDPLLKKANINFG
jgi:V8-like Glu-specific endopeptidase